MLTKILYNDTIHIVVAKVHVAGWLNWLERPVHTREVESSSLSPATISKYYGYSTNVVGIRYFMRFSGFLNYP